MAFKVMLDANVCLDFLLRRQEYPISKQLFQKVFDREVSAFITPTIFHIIAYFLSKYYSKEDAKNILLNFLLDVDAMEADHEIMINALTSSMSDIEDALQYYTAIHHKVDYFLTYDKDFQKASLPILPVISPGSFLGLYYN